jgi:hypothetical protein
MAASQISNNMPVFPAKDRHVKKHLISLAALALIAGCSSSADFSIDNPTDTSLKLQIDGTAYDIPAHQAKDVSLKAGEHSMDAPATGKIKFIVYAGRKGGLLNPSLSDYVIVSESYVTDASKLKNFAPAGGGPFELDGVKFNGPFELANGLFIDNDWRFGVREPFPDSLQGYDAGNGGNIFRKIFTASDFVAYYEQQSGQPDFFEKNRLHNPAAPKPLATTPPLPVFADATTQEASLKLRQLYQDYLHATDPARQKQLQEEYGKLIMDFTTATATLASSRPVEENVKQNEFVERIGAAMGKSAQVEN